VAAINNDVDRPDPTGEAAAYSFLQRRLDEANRDLRDAQRAIGKLTRQICDLEIGQPPPEVEHALAIRTARMRPLKVEVAGRTLSLAIPAQGIQSPALQRHIWRTLHERYGSQEQ
jgi:hypothetical protein